MSDPNPERLHSPQISTAARVHANSWTEIKISAATRTALRRRADFCAEKWKIAKMSILRARFCVPNDISYARGHTHTHTHTESHTSVLVTRSSHAAHACFGVANA